MGTQTKTILAVVAILAVAGAVGVTLHLRNAEPDAGQAADQSASDKAEVRPEVAALPPPDGSAPAAEVAAGQPIKPTFDIVRVESTGELVAAGRSAVAARVQLDLADTSLAKADANLAGEWALVVTEALKPGSYDLVLRATGENGSGELVEGDRVTVVIESPDTSPLVAVAREGEPMQVLQQPESEPETSPAPAAGSESSETKAPPTIVSMAPPEAGTGKTAAAESKAPAQVASAPTSGQDSTPATDAPQSGQPSQLTPPAQSGPAQSGSAQTEPAQFGPAQAEPAQSQSADETAASQQSGLVPPVASNQAEPSPPGSAASGSTQAAASAPVEPAVSGEAKLVAQPPAEPAASGETQVAAAPAQTPSQTGATAANAGLEQIPAGDLAIETVEIEEPDHFMLSGSAAPGASVRLYLNNERLADVKAGNTGHWTLTTARPMPPGRYEVRADVVTGTGNVTARAEVRFDRVRFVADDAAGGSGEETIGPGSGVTIVSRGAGGGSEDPAAAGSEGETSVVVIARGDSLWRIARKIYGQGIRHSVIYDANRNQIRNPNLIYPGQVFTIPVLDQDDKPNG
jgi:nucleoid-associated protein YgaU